MIANIDVFIRAHTQSLRTGLTVASQDMNRFGRDMLGLNRNLHDLNSRVLWESQHAARSMLMIGAAAVVGVGLAVKTTADFEQSMRNVNSLAQQTEEQFSKTSAAVIAMTRDLPISANDLAKGLYDIVSSGFDGADALNVLAASAHAAAAGLSDTRTAARAITGVLNAYGPVVGNAAYVSDVLFKTVDVGVVTFEELAQNMGQFIGIASQTGVSLEEVGAAYATMTRAGVPAAQASTALMRVISAFVKPSKEMTALIEKISGETPYAFLQARGLAGAFNEINTALGGSVPALATVFHDIRGLRGALALASQDGKLYNEVLGEFSDKNDIAGSTARALDQQSKSLSFQMGLLKNAVQEAGISLGQQLLPGVKAGTSMFTSFARGISDIPGPLKLIAFGTAAVVLSLTSLAAATILIAPRMAAAKIAIDELSASMPRLAAATDIATASLGTLLGLAAAAGILATVALNAQRLSEIGQRPHIGHEHINELTNALVDLAKASDDLEKNHAIDNISKLGRVGRKSLAASANDVFGLGVLGDRFLPKSFTRDPNLDFTTRLTDVDKALTSLVQTGHADTARDALEKLSESSSFMGMTAEELAKKHLPNYRDAIAGVKTEAKAAGKSVDAFGVSVGVSEDDVNDAANAVKEYESYLKGIQSELAKFIDGTQAINDIQDAHKRAADDASKQADAEQRIADGIDAQREAQLKMDQAQAQIDIIMSATHGRAPIAGTKEYDDWTQAQKDMINAKQAQAKATKDSKTAEQEYNDKLKENKVSLAEYRAELRKQIEAQAAWIENLNKIGSRGVSDAVIEQLRSLGPEGAGIVAELANAPKNIFDESVMTIQQSADRTSLGFARQVDTEMKVAQIVGRDGAALTVHQILDKLNELAPGMGAIASDVQVAMAAIGAAIQSGAKTGIDALNDLGTAIDSAVAAAPSAFFDASPNVPSIPVTPAMATSPIAVPPIGPPLPAAQAPLSGFSSPAGYGSTGGSGVTVVNNFNEKVDPQQVSRHIAWKFV